MLINMPPSCVPYYQELGKKLYPLGTLRVQAVQAVRFERAKDYLNKKKAQNHVQSS